MDQLRGIPTRESEVQIEQGMHPVRSSPAKVNRMDGGDVAGIRLVGSHGGLRTNLLC